jgi:hypothetical protein
LKRSRRPSARHWRKRSLLLCTRTGLAEIDRSLEVLSDAELDTVIERARQRAGPLGDEAVTAIIDEAIRAARAHGRS